MKKICSYIFIFILMNVLVFKGLSQPFRDSTLSRVENPQPFHVAYKTNLFTPLWGVIPFTAEYKIMKEFTVRPYQSMQLGVSYLSKGLLLLIAQGQNNGAAGPGVNRKFYATGFRLQYSHRFYAKQKLFYDKPNYSPSGFYHGPMASYATAKIGLRGASSRSYYILASNLQLCWITGFQAVSKQGFVFDIYFGMGYKHNALTEYNRRGARPISIKDFPFYRSPFKMLAGFNIGFAID